MPPDDLPDDLQRPLDESQPETPPEPPATEPAGAEPAGAEPELRPAVPREPEGPRGPEVRVHRRDGLSRILIRATRRRLRRGATALAAWSRGPAGRLALPGLLIAILVGSAVAAGSLVLPAVSPTGGGGPEPAVQDTPRQPAVPPTLPATDLPVPPTAGPAEPVGVPATRAEALLDWAEEMSLRTDVPVVALQAYGYAELVVTRTTPGCRLSWTTLAAIGRVESNHGRTGDSQLLPDGRALPPITGEALDGTGGRKLIYDTDGGELDGDPVYDRAIGPMQFIPQTWQREAVDATGDGIADIHNIHDAALAAANYLCRFNRDLSSATGWWSAVLSYNNVQAYADEVFAAANEYGLLSRT